jgi:hypothetical protein
MSKPVTVGDLPDLVVQERGHGPDPFLFCEFCGAQYSAHAGDYWDRPKDQIMTCCEEPMCLVVKQVKYVDWKKPDGQPKAV